MFHSEHAELLMLHAVSPIHAGSGSSTGAVDLPIQRERHTGRPIVQSSGLKGALREAVERGILAKKMMPQANWETKKKLLAESNELKALFGADRRLDQSDTQAGSLSVSDAKVLLFPVRSSHAPFLYVTAPQVLRQLNRDLLALGQNEVALAEVRDPGSGKAIAFSEKVSFEAEATGGIVLEDLRVQASKDLDDGLRGVLAKLLDPVEAGLLDQTLLLSNTDFQYLVETACPVQTRIVLGPNGTTSESGGNLWYEELLPADTLLYALSFCSAERKDEALPADCLRKFLTDHLPEHLQIGGDATLGRGFCRLHWSGHDMGAPPRAGETDTSQAQEAA